MIMDAKSVAFDPEAAVVGWVVKSPEPAVIVSPEGGILWLNAAARRYAREMDPDCVNTNEPLRFWQTMVGKAFRTILLGAAYSCPVGQSRTLVYPNSSGKRCVIKVTPLGPDSESPLGISVPLSGSISPIQSQDMMSAFGLTGAETRLLGCLVEGLLVQDAAAKIGISVSTARTQIRSIYSKLQVSNREGMFAVIMPFLRA